MLKLRFFWQIIFIGVISAACAPTNTSKTTSKSETYEEDLSSYRPEVDLPTAEPVVKPPAKTLKTDSATLPVNHKLNTVLDSAASYARTTINYIDGFTIQVYGGTDRNAARDFRMDLLRNFPQTDPIMVFEQPNYKVRVGQYYTRLEAQHFFLQVRHIFPQAILIPTRISVD